MALVEQLGDNSSEVECAACCHVALVFWYLPLCIYIKKLYCVCPFFFPFFFVFFFVCLFV